MPPLTQTEQSLFDLVRDALPRFLFQRDNDPQETFAGFAKLFGKAKDQLDFWISQTLISSAAGIWLDQHALDRGTRRQAGESDSQLRARLQTIPDAITKPAIIRAALKITLADGNAVPPALLELRQDRAFLGKDPATGFARSYLSRGYRITTWRPSSIILILPFGSTPGAIKAAAEMLRIKKAAGIKATIEVRRIP